MTGIYLKPLVDFKGNAYFAIMTAGIRHPVMTLTKTELEKLIIDANEAIVMTDEMAEAINKGVKK